MQRDKTAQVNTGAGGAAATSRAVAIDGPGGAGKSTVAKKVAAALGMVYIDTGAMYRAVALYHLRRGTNLQDSDAVAAALPEMEIVLRHNETGQRLFLNGEDVTEALRTQPVAEGSSVVAAYAAVREQITSQQRGLAQKGEVVMDGRDTGTNIIPWAPVKIYLDASLEERTRRRVQELREKGEQADPETVRQEIAHRDARDKNRTHAPLIQAKDAVYIDSSTLSPDEVAQRIIHLANAIPSLQN